MISRSDTQGHLPVSHSKREQELESEVRQLQAKIDELQKRTPWPVAGETVRVPEPLKPLFEVAQQTVARYFSQAITDPTKATIEISGERYVLLRASSLSVDFLTTIKNLYSDYGEDKAFAIGRNFLFDISHVIGIEDAKTFHRKMGLTDPIAKLSAGPIHFAYSGWAFVDISPESSPKPNDDYFLKYDHPFSFEADAWIKAGRRSDHPVCIMNSGYSSGWCEESFGLPLTAVELTCKAAGDDSCTFIMAPPHRIEEHLGRVQSPRISRSSLQIPSFFERKRVEEEMRAARRKAEESDRMKSEFLANMSHEIRSPMSSVIGMTDLALETELTETQREYLLAARGSAESLMAIINQVLDFSKIEAGAIVLDSQPFELREVLSETIKPFSLRGESKGIDVGWNVAEEIPDRLIGDWDRLRQVIVNLVGNAVKFTDQGRVDVDVALEERDEPNNRLTLHFRVTDTGIGIPPGNRESVFDAFTQVDMSTTRRYGGTGLGLTISDTLVRLMNGRIWCESNEPSGCSFHFVAQFGVGGDATANREGEASEVARGAVALGDQQEAGRDARLKILVAEDSRVNQMVTVGVLERLGHAVTIAGNGREAVQLWQDSPSDFDLILMDVLMPELDGPDATAAIRKLEEGTGRRVPIIAVTAQAMKGDRELCLNAGMDDYISKPIQKGELERVIDRFIR
jgi:signal transduction histidine kinase/CheY-like chemotaxis protein